jgi:anti-anti-sigma regulatory factor
MLPTFMEKRRLFGSAAPKLAARLDELNRSGRLTVDCSQLTFCDSTGVAALLDHAPIVVRSPRPQLVKVFEITGMTSIIEAP